MSEFKIRSTFELDDKKARKQLDDLKNQVGKKALKMNVELNLSKINGELNKLQGAMKRALKIDNSTIAGLKQIENAVKQINKLNRTQLPYKTKNTDATNDVNKTISQYKRLMSERAALEKQMSKTTNSQSYQMLNNQLERVKTNITSVTSKLDGMKVNTNFANTIERSLSSTFQNVQSKIEKMQSQLSKHQKLNILDGKESTELNNLINKLNQLKNIKLSNITSGKDSFFSMSKLVSDVDQVQRKFSNLKINTNIGSQLSSQINKITNEATSLQNKIGNLFKSGYTDKGQLSNMARQLQTIQNINFSKLNPNQIQSVTNALSNMTSKVKEVDSAAKQLKAKDAFNIKTDKARADLSRLRQECVNLGQSTSQIDRLENELRQLSNLPLDKQANGLSRIRNEIGNMRNSFSGLNSATKQTNGFFSDLYRSFSTFTIGNMIGMKLQQGVRAIGTTIIALDDGLRDLMKVAPDDFKGTSEQLDGVKRKAIETGKSVARASEDVIQGTAKALQTGISNVDDAMKVAKRTSLYANVSDLQNDVAETHVTAIMSAYGGMANSLKPAREQIKGMSKDYSQLQMYTDLANYAGNNFALTSGDVGESLMRSGSMLSSFGVSMSDSISLIVGMQEGVQNAEKTGTALKSIATNLAGVKSSAKDGTMESNKTAKTLKEIANIDVWNKQTGEVKDMMTTLTELNGVWKDLNSDQKAAISESIAGKYHINAFLGLMDRWNQVKKYQSEVGSGLAIGSADKENERYINSISGKIVVLKENLKEALTNLISTDAFKGLVDFGISITGMFAKITAGAQKMGASIPLAVGTLSTLFMTIKGLGTNSGVPNLFGGLAKHIDNLTTKTKALNVYSEKVKKAQTISKGEKNYRIADTSSGTWTNIRRVGNEAEQSGKKLQTYSDKIKKTNAVQLGRGQNTYRPANEASKQMLNVVSSAQKGAQATGKFTSALAGFGKGLLSTIGNGLVIGAAFAGISVALQGVSDYINRFDISSKKHTENIENLQSEIGNLTNQKESLGSFAKEFDELSNKSNKTTEDFEKLSGYKKQIAEMFPDLVAGFDQNNDPILQMNGSAQDLVKTLQDAIKEKRELMADEKIEKGNDAIGWFHQKDRYKEPESNRKEAQRRIAEATRDEREALNRYKSANLTNGEALWALDKYRKKRAEKQQLISKEYNDYVKSMAESDKHLADLRGAVNTELYRDTNFNNLTKQAQQFATNLSSSLDFSSLDKGNVDTYISNITGALQKSKGTIPPILQEYQQLREELNKTGQFDLYEGKVNKLIPKMADLLGMNEDTVKNMIAVPPAMKMATSALDSYLMTFGKREKMKGFDQETANLVERYKAFDKISNKLTDRNSYEVEGGELVLKQHVVTKLIEDNDTPKEVKSLIEAFKKKNGGELTKEDSQILIDLSMAYQLGDAPGAESILDEIQDQIDKSLPGNNINIKDIAIKANYNVEEQGREKLDALMNEMDEFKGRDDVKLALGVKMVGEDQLQKYADIITKLPANESFTNQFIIENIDNLQQLNSYQEVIEYIKENPQLALQYHMNIDGIDNLEKLQSIYDELPKEVQTQVNNGVIGLDKLELVQQMYDKLPKGDENARKIITDFIVNNVDNISKVKDWDSLVKLMPDNVKKALGIEITTTGTEEAKEGKKVVDEAKNNNANQTVKTETTGTDEAKDSKKTVDEAKDNSAKQNVETTSTGKEEAKQNKETVDSAKGNTAVQTIVTRKEGDNPEEVKNQLLSTNGATATTYIKLQTEGQEETNQAKQQVESLSGMSATAQIELQTTGLENGEKAEQTVKKADGKKAKTSIEVAMEGVDKVNQALQQVEKISGKKIAPLVFNAVTATAAKNISGLISRISQFERKPKSFTTKFNASTATAAKNISGLMRKIDAFKASYTGTITTNFVVNTSYTTSGSPPSSGGNNGGKKKSSVQGFAFKTASLDQPVTSSMFNKASISTFADYPEESMAPMMRSGLTTLSTPVSIMPKAANLLSAPRLLSSPLLSRSRSIFGYKPSIAHDGSSLEKYFKNDIEFLKELEAAIKKVTNAIGLLDTKMKNASASDKVKYLQEQNTLYVEQQRLIKEQIKAEGELLRQRNWLKDNLKKKGFKIDNTTGNMTNYEELLRDKADALNKAEEKANKKNAKDADKDKYEKLKKEYDEMKKMADAYFELEFDKIPKLEQEWEELNNKRIEAEKEIKKLQEEAWQTSWDAKWASADKHVKELNNELAMVDILMKNAFGTEKDALIKRKIELLEKQKQEMKDTNKLLADSMQHQKSKLIEFGFKFNNNGDITNYEQQIVHLQQTSGDFEEAKKYAEEYLNLFTDKIPEANRNMAEMENKIKEAYKQQLEITKSIEDQITKMYEKQVEERKKLIDKELKAKVDALNKEKEAYNDARKEADYQKDYDKQLESVNKLQKQLDIAKRDTSLSGQKKVKELLEKLKEEQEKLQDMVQDKIDDDINNMYDKEVDRLEEDAEKNKEDLDERYNKENIQKWVQEALNTGMFTDIDGKVSDLGQTMLDFTDKWGEGLGATGDIIKGELIANLEIARDIMKDMDSMKDKLGLTSDYYNKKTSQDYLKETMDSAKNLADAIAGMRVQQNAPLVYIEGNVDKAAVPDITRAMEKAQEEFASKIVKNMKF